MRTPSLHLSTTHPVASVAAEHCNQHAAPLVGGVACGKCWEQAIRDDERFAIENGLPAELATDPFLVDHVAVARAMQGQLVALTSFERSLTAIRLRAAGVTLTDIGRLLRVGQHAVLRYLQQSAGDPDTESPSHGWITGNAQPTETFTASSAVA